MTKNEVKRFIKTHRDKEFSPAKFEYSLFLYKDAEEKMYDFANKVIPRDKTEEKANRQMIEEMQTAEDIVQLMRKGLKPDERLKIVQKAIEMEEETLPLVKKRALTNRQDVFIENALKYFLRCKTNCCEWILENYAGFKSEYLKSMLCLVLGAGCWVLGLRGNADMIEFLIKEAERFEHDYPNESFDQGPALAVRELVVRFPI